MDEQVWNLEFSKIGEEEGLAEFDPDCNPEQAYSKFN
jgi:hypothetical protein